MGNKAAKEKAAADGVDVTAHDDSSFTDALRVHLQRLIVYAEGSDPALQREVAEMLANEAVKPERQMEIVELGGQSACLQRLTIRNTCASDFRAQASAYFCP